MNAFNLALAGYKGARVLRTLLARGLRPGRVQTYRQKGDATAAHDEIERLARSCGATFELGSRLAAPIFDDLLFFVGWQFAVSAPEARIVVFHDSLLPKYRGFAPTIAALLAGDERIGVTALLPTREIDAGPIVGQAAHSIEPFARVEHALNIQSGLIAGLLAEIVARGWNGLEPVEQDHAQASFSLWRDEHDYVINWSLPAVDVLRHVRASGYPYAGARTVAGGTDLVVRDAALVDRVRLARPAPGKIVAIEDGVATVSCADGCLRLDEVEDICGRRFAFDRLRQRLG